MKTIQRPACTCWCTPFAVRSLAAFRYLLTLLLVCAASAPAVHAGVWDALEDLGADIIRQGSDPGRDRYEPRRPPPPPPPGTFPAPPPPQSRQPVLRPNYNYDRQKVAQAQRLLNRLGYDAGAVDGLYGRSTRRAILAYQTDRGLPRRGDVTARLLGRLAREAPPATVVAEPEPPQRQQPARQPSNYNSDRQRVAKVQALLNRLGYDAGTVDGVYGPSTRSAIRAYQAVQGLPLRGDVTAALIARLAQETAPTGVAATRATRAPPGPGQPAQPPQDYNSDQQKVATAQTLLKRLGYYPGTANGRYDPTTRMAIRLYQAEQKLPPSGDVTDELLARLAQDTRQSSGSTALPAQTRAEPSQPSSAQSSGQSSDHPPEHNAPPPRASGAAKQSSGQDVAVAEQVRSSRTTPDSAAAARPGEACTPVDTAPDGSTVIAGTAPPDGVLCYRIATVPGRSVSIDVIEGSNIIVTVLGVIDAVDHTEFTATASSHVIRVGQLMRSVTNESFRIRIVTAPAGHGRAAPHAFAYVALRNAAAVAVVDLDRGVVVKRIPVGSLPRGTTASADGSTVAVVNDGDATVSVIDTATDTVVETLNYSTLKQRALAQLSGGQIAPEDVQALAEIGHVVLGPAGRRVYVGAPSFGVLSVDRASDEVRLVGGATSGRRRIGPTNSVLKISTDGTRLYLPDFAHQGLSIIDTRRMTLIGTVPGFYSWQFDVSDDGRFAVQYRGGMLSRADLETFEIRQLFPKRRLRSSERTLFKRLEISPDGRRAYIERRETEKMFGRVMVNRIIAFDLETGDLAAQVTVGKQPTSGMALTPDGRRVVITSPATNTLHVYDAANLDELNTIKVAPTPKAYIDFIITKPAKAGQDAASANDLAAGAE